MKGSSNNWPNNGYWNLATLDCHSIIGHSYHRLLIESKFWAFFHHLVVSPVEDVPSPTCQLRFRSDSDVCENPILWPWIGAGAGARLTYPYMTLHQWHSLEEDKEVRFENSMISMKIESLVINELINRNWFLYLVVASVFCVRDNRMKPVLPIELHYK